MKGKPGSGISLLLWKRTKGAAKLKVPIQRTNRYQQCIYMHIIYIAEGFGGETSDSDCAPPFLLVPEIFFLISTTQLPQRRIYNKLYKASLKCPYLGINL